MLRYNFLEKLIHEIFLGNKFVNKSLFEVEKFLFLKKKKISKNFHIFISGLPRSGTTILLNFIYSTKEFASLKYSNMPFLLSPNFSNIINKKKISKFKRLQDDGIYYDLESPEAFDEFFFSENKEFVKDELLNYLSLILKSQNKNKYISKNNLNYKRISFIKSILPNSLFLIPIRHPLHHAYSLLNQHLSFSRLQKNDRFIMKYMKYLSHNEFGLSHKPWNNPVNHKNPNDMNYWLEQWYLFYEKILKNSKYKKNCSFIIYEKLSNKNYLKNLLKKLNLNSDKNLNLKIFKNKNKNKNKIKFEYNKYIFKKSLKIYKKLSQI